MLTSNETAAVAAAAVGPDGKHLFVGADSNGASILPKLVLGNVKLASDPAQCQSFGIQAIINLISYTGHKGTPPTEQSVGIPFRHCPVLDIPSSGLDWAEAAAQWVETHVNCGRVTLIHCSQGISRAATLTLYYLMTRENMTLHQAFTHIKGLRPVICPSMGFVAGLVRLDQERYPAKDTVRMTLHGYSAACIQSIFPDLPRGAIEEALEKARSDLSSEAIEEFKQKVGNSNIEPVGYLAIDIILANPDFQELLVKRKGCSLHHPFD